MEQTPKEKKKEEKEKEKLGEARRKEGTWELSWFLV